MQHSQDHSFDGTTALLVQHQGLPAIVFRQPIHSGQVFKWRSDAGPTGNLVLLGEGSALHEIAPSMSGIDAAMRSDRSMAASFQVP